MPFIRHPTILAADHVVQPIAEFPDASPAEHWVIRFWGGRDPDTDRGRLFTEHGMPTEQTDERVAVVEINHGRWVVRCPWCPTAQMAALRDRRFFCTTCSNGDTGKWVVTQWPEDTAGIEAALQVRDERTKRNWKPGETPELLRAETLLRTGT